MLMHSPAIMIFFGQFFVFHDSDGIIIKNHHRFIHMAFHY